MTQYIVILEVDQDNDPVERKNRKAIKGATGAITQTNKDFPDMNTDPEGFKKALHAWHVKNNPQYFADEE